MSRPDKAELDDFKTRLARKGYQGAAQQSEQSNGQTLSTGARYRREELPALSLPEKNVTVSPAGERSAWLLVTPAMAGEWLKHVREQRKYRKTTGAAYARDMRKGHWLTTHQGIAFDVERRLIDGQHRLHAIVLTGKTVPMLVSWGLRVKIEGRKVTTMDTLDRGLPRSVPDQLKLNHNVSNPNLTAACANLCARLALGSKYDAGKRTVSDVLGSLEVYGADIGALVAAAEKRPVARLRMAPVCGALAFARVADTEAIDAFYESLQTGANLSSTSPALMVRNFLLNGGSQGKSRMDLSWMVLNAARAHLEKRPMKTPLFGDEGRAWFASRQPKRVQQIGELFA